MADMNTATALTQPEQPTWLALAWRTAKNLQKCMHWAWLDTICQYRRSTIGPMWETINMFVMIAGITLVSSAIFGGDIVEVASYVGLGIIVWSVIVSVVNDGAATFVRSTSYITGTNFSIDLYIGRTIFKTAINFGHHIILYFLALLILPLHVGWTALLAVIGIALLFLNAYWAVVVFAFLSARFRDVELILRNLLQLAFFMTPVFWNYRQLAADRKFIVDYNLLYYYIEIVRAPLLGEVPPLGHYLVVLGCTILGYLLAIATYRRMRRQLAFFVS